MIRVLKSREVLIPETEVIFGALEDESAEVKRFELDRFTASGDDLSGCDIRINARGLEHSQRAPIRIEYLITD